MIRGPPRSTLSSSSAASDVYKRQTITKSMLEEADTLKDMNLPKGTLVMIVKRGDEFLIPNGTLKLHEGDKLLLISEKSKEEDTDSE